MPLQSRPIDLDETVHHFLVESHHVTTEAQFIIDSLPNAERPAVERIAHQLEAIRDILMNLEDPTMTLEERESLISYVSHLLNPLQSFLRNPPPPPQMNIPRNFTDSPGRPAYILDLVRARELHLLGNTWDEVAKAMGVSRSTLYNHMAEAGLSTARKDWTEINDDALDELVAEISMSHPFVGSAIVQGHLEARAIHVPRERVQESLRRVDAIGVLVRWAGIIRRRVYKVRGSNALWHIDANEKLRPWGFWVHGCIDGFSRLIVYMSCNSNKRAATVSALFTDAVSKFGWPSRGRGDYGRENNYVEKMLFEHWGAAHRAFLRGRSLHNIRIERLWRDIRKDSLEAFRQIFMYLEENGLLLMDDPIHRTCLFLVFQPRIQQSLNRTREAWNHHKIRTEHNRTPVAIYELSREAAINAGYWTGDPGDGIDVAADPMYGYDGEAPLPPQQESNDEDLDLDEPNDIEEERSTGLCLNRDDELEEVASILHDFDFHRDDGNWGIEGKSDVGWK